jgi:Exonuclease V gamma subunit
MLYIYPPSDGNIYKYMPQALKCIYSISHTATSPPKHTHKIVAMTYGGIHLFCFNPLSQNDICKLEFQDLC